MLPEVPEAWQYDPMLLAAAQALLDARNAFPEATLADLYGAGGPGALLFLRLT